MRRAVFGLIIWAILCLMIVFPARWAAGWLPNTATAYIAPGSIRGTVWNGQVKIIPPRTSWPVSVSYKANVFKGIFGQAFVQTLFSGHGLHGKANVGMSGARDVMAEIQIQRLPISDPRLTGAVGDIFLSLDHLKMGPDCEQADGHVRTNILGANQERWRWQGPVLSGPISCDGEAVLIALSGADESLDVRLDLRLYKEGRYDVDMALLPSRELPPTLGFVLSVLGFEEQSDGSARLKEQGNIFQGPRS